MTDYLQTHPYEWRSRSPPTSTSTTLHYTVSSLTRVYCIVLRCVQKAAAKEAQQLRLNGIIRAKLTKVIADAHDAHRAGGIRLYYRLILSQDSV